MSDEAIEKIKQKKKEIIEEGGVFARLYFQLFGKEKEALLNLAKGFSAALVKAKGVEIGATEIAEVEKLEDGYFSTYLIAHLVFSSPKDLFELVVDTHPFSIEVVEPEELTLNIGKMNEILHSLSSYSFELKRAILEANPEKRQLMKRIAAERVRLGEKLGKKEESSKKEEQK